MRLRRAAHSASQSLCGIVALCFGLALMLAGPYGDYTAEGALACVVGAGACVAIPVSVRAMLLPDEPGLLHHIVLVLVAWVALALTFTSGAAG